MFNKGRKQGKGQGSGQGFGKRSGSEFCVCTKCGYSIPHEQGMPCRSTKCPVCSIPLIRSDSDIKITNANTNNPKTKNVKYPKIDPDICTGCGTCIDVCPMGAISLKDRTAYIDESKCGNCRLCINECPVEAIS